MYEVYNLHIRESEPMPSPAAMKSELPITDAIARTVYEARATTKRILRGEDPRLLVIVGPCSIHDPAAAIEYAERLRALQDDVRDRLFLVMRTYFEKPRTTIGWRGLMNDPHLDGSFDMIEGLRQARRLLLAVTALGVPTATEMLDPIMPQYISDLVGVTAVGARTTESQTHRAMASGLSMPVGFKNGTDGSIAAAVNACLSARHQHSFLGISEEGQCTVFRTNGNPDSFVVLRGGSSGPNYSAAFVADALARMRKSDLHPAVMVDCSHANAQGDFQRQEVVWHDLMRQRRAGTPELVGVMLESNLHEGKQTLGSDLTQLHYGVSVTDACIGWETTAQLLRAG